MLFLKIANALLLVADTSALPPIMVAEFCKNFLRDVIVIFL
jgi:hypothetical protein